MKLLFVDKALSDLSDSDAQILYAIKEILLSVKDIEEVCNPEKADAIILQEENSFKNFRYIKDLESDELISAYPQKVFTINTDDCATGLLRGLYTSLPKYRFYPGVYRSVPYMQFPNDLVFNKDNDKVTPMYLASWRGNTKSNGLRQKMVRLLKAKNEFCIEKTNSWLNHNDDEKNDYVNLIRAAKFSLCPAGWAPVSFRIYESMALGKCPVIIADDFVPPHGPNWNKFALFYPEKDIAGLSSFLLSKEHLANDLGENAFNAWQNYFSRDVIKEYYANTLLSLIRQTARTSKEAELKRWKSLKVNWNNKWT
ncbi:MAG: hypothetical protein JWR76_317, partial [Mucilaginibacter sp.]|nr:hypothetical protein [Mucilaginibacter sp.]